MIYVIENLNSSSLCTAALLHKYQTMHYTLKRICIVVVLLQLLFLEWFILFNKELKEIQPQLNVNNLSSTIFYVHCISNKWYTIIWYQVLPTFRPMHITCIYMYIKYIQFYNNISPYGLSLHFSHHVHLPQSMGPQ